jgi:hypothetical protein
MLLLNSPRLRFSVEQTKAMLYWATSLGATVPTMYELGLAAKTMASTLGGDPIRYDGIHSKSILYFNDICSSISKVCHYHRIPISATDFC